MTLKAIGADKLMCGDEVVINHHLGRVKYIDGPDRLGTYDVHIVDTEGKERIEVVTGTVTLAL